MDLLGSRISSVLLLLPCFVLGCGAGPINAGETGSETGEESETSGDGDGDPSGDGDGDGGEGDGDPEPVIPGECIVDGELVRPLAVFDGANASVQIHGDGVFDTLTPALPAQTQELSFDLASNATHLALASNYVFSDPGQGYGSLVQLYDRNTGELEWEQGFEFRLGGLRIDPSGRVTARVGWNGGNTPSLPDAVIVDADGITQMFGLVPRGPIRADGWMPVQIYDVNGNLLGMGFYELETETLEEVFEGSGAWVNAETGAIEYIDNQDPAPRFVSVEPGQLEAIELAALGGGFDSAHIEVSTGDYRIIGAYDGESESVVRVRLEVDEASVIALAPSLPPELEPFDCYGSAVSLDARGRVVYELRDAASAQVWAWEPDADSWEQLGQSMSEVDDITTRSASDHVIEIFTMGTGMTFCPLVEWPEPPPGALLSTTLQLTRVEPALSVELELEPDQWGASAAVDAGESCAVWATTEGLSVIDLGDLDRLDLGVSGFATWIDGA